MNSKSSKGFYANEKCNENRRSSHHSGRYGSNQNGFSRSSNGYGSSNGYRSSTTISKAPTNMIIRKDFYTSLLIKKSYNYDEISEYFRKEAITVKGTNIPDPIIDFNDYPWPRFISSGFNNLGHKKPTAIQAQGWPIALAGRDMVGIAMTGSGKTLSYILPAFVHIDAQLNERRDYGPMALVLAPTRELAQQIQEVVCQFHPRFSSVCVVGGASKGPQIKEIKRNSPQIVIATPGRLNDFLESGIISLSNISFLVLDEADRMLDMGFEPQIRKIVSTLTISKRQTLMWSATWPKEVRALAGDFLTDYIQINVGALQLHANHNITQIVDICEELDKKDKLFGLLGEIMREDKENKTIIFAETKRKVDDLTKQMRHGGWPAMCIHGDKSQSEREWVLKEFRSGRSPILVATDVAARGLDVEDIKYVINFDYPNTTEDYVHRIGRTGRKDKKGTAYTFFTKANFKQANELINVLREANQVVNPKLVESAGRGGITDYNKYRRYGMLPKSYTRASFGSKNGFASKSSAFSSTKFDGSRSFVQKRKSRFDDLDGPTKPKQSLNGYSGSKGY